MRIRLVSRQHPDSERVPYSLPVLQLQAVLRAHEEELGFPIVVDRHQLAREQHPARALRSLTDEAPDVVALYLDGDDWLALAPIVEAMVSLLPELTVIVGGPATRGRELELLQRHPFIEVVLCDEVEVALFETIAGLHKRKSFPQYRFHDVLGIAVRNEAGEPELTLERPAVEPLDLLPSPLSGFAEPLITLGSTAVYETHRGCRFHCTLCDYGGSFKRRRGFSLERVEADIAAIDAAGCTELTLTDALFNDDPKRTLELVQLFNGSRTLQRFYANLRADRVTDELHRAFDAKIWSFLCGIFSTRAETLESLKREMDLDVARTNIERLIAAGHQVTLQIVAALPREGWPDLARSLDWAISISGARVRLLPLRIVPGTEMELHHEGLGLIRGPRSWRSPTLATPDLPQAEMLRLLGIERLLRWLERDPLSAGPLRGELARHFDSVAEALSQFLGHLETAGVECIVGSFESGSGTRALEVNELVLRDELQRFSASVAG